MTALVTDFWWSKNICYRIIEEKDCLLNIKKRFSNTYSICFVSCLRWKNEKLWLLRKKNEGRTRSWTMDLSICSRLLYHWAIHPFYTNFQLSFEHILLTPITEYREVMHLYYKPRKNRCSSINFWIRILMGKYNLQKLFM